jgi:hypothetical protein
MQATSQEVQDKLGLLRKLMVSIRLLIETRQVLPLAKDRKSVELHGREQIFFFDKTSTSDFIASQGTSVQGRSSSWLSQRYSVLRNIIAAYHIKNE